MAKNDIVRSNGNYKVQALNDIILETQYHPDYGTNQYKGTVTVRGNLVVTGASTQIESSDISISDRILKLNKGEIGPGITVEGVSGLEIDRGGNQLENGYLWFNESKQWTYGTTHIGMWEVKAGNANSGIVLNAIRTQSSATNLSLLGQENATAVVTVEGTTDYETRVVHDDHIPNKKFIDIAIANQPERRRLLLNWYDGQGVLHSDLTTRIELTDSNIPSSGATEPQIRIAVNNEQYITVFDNRLEVGLIRFKNSNEITMKAFDTPLVLSTSPSVGSVNNPSVVLKTSLALDMNSAYQDPLYNANQVKIYPGTTGSGGTGLYFVSSDNIRGELPSKRRSFFASLMF